MYEALDSFLRIQNWHECDRQSRAHFHRSLAELIEEKGGFHPDELGIYLRQRTPSLYHHIVDMYVSLASSILEFLYDSAPFDQQERALQ